MCVFWRHHFWKISAIETTDATSTAILVLRSTAHSEPTDIIGQNKSTVNGVNPPSLLFQGCTVKNKART